MICEVSVLTGIMFRKLLLLAAVVAIAQASPSPFVGVVRGVLRGVGDVVGAAGDAVGSVTSTAGNMVGSVVSAAGEVADGVVGGVVGDTSYYDDASPSAAQSLSSAASALEQAARRKPAAPQITIQQSQNTDAQ